MTRIPKAVARLPANLVSAFFVATAKHAYNQGKALLSAFGKQLLITKDKVVNVLPVAKKCAEQVKHIASHKSDLAATVKQSAIDTGFSFFSKHVDVLLSGDSAPSLATAGKESFMQLASSVSEKVAGNCTALVSCANETIASMQETVALVPDVHAFSMKDFLLGVLQSEESLATMSTALTDSISDICFDMLNEKINFARQITKAAIATGVFMASGVAIKTALLSYLSIRSVTGVLRLIYRQQ